MSVRITDQAYEYIGLYFACGMKKVKRELVLYLMANFVYNFLALASALSNYTEVKKDYLKGPCQMFENMHIF